MPQGGGQVFQLDPRLYGGYGLGDSFNQIGQILSGVADRSQKRKDKKREDLLQQLEVAGQVFGHGSPQYAAIARQITGEQTAQPIVPISEQQLTRLNEAQARIAAGTGTPDDQTLVNMTLYGGALGLPGARTQAQNQLDLSTLQTDEARRTTADDTERRRILQTQGHTPGELAASLDINKVVASEEELSNMRARTGLTREQINTERAQQQALRAQAAHAYAEARAASQADNSPFTRQDATYLAGLRVRLEQAGMTLPNTQFLAAGLQGALPQEQQTAFNEGYRQYANEQRQKWSSEVERAAAADPNNPRTIAARNLQQYYTALRNKQEIRGVTDQQVAEWNATVMGGEARQEGFRRRWVIDWGPSTFQGAPVSARPPTGRTQPTAARNRIDPAEATNAVQRLITAQGGDVEKARGVLNSQRNTLNTRNPGSGDALLQVFNALHPSSANTTTNRNTTSNNNTTLQTRLIDINRRLTSLRSSAEPDVARIGVLEQEKGVIEARLNRNRNHR